MRKIEEWKTKSIILFRQCEIYFLSVTTLFVGIVWIVVPVSCTPSPKQNIPEECASLPMGVEKDDCWGNCIIEVFSADSQKGMQIMESEISNPKVRDFLWLEITRKINPTTMTYCKKIADKDLFNRCQTLVSRPHLHRESLRSNEGSSAPVNKQQDNPLRPPQ